MRGAAPRPVTQHRLAGECPARLLGLPGEGSQVLRWKPESLPRGQGPHVLGSPGVWVSRVLGTHTHSAPRPGSEKEFWTSCCCIVFSLEKCVQISVD